MVRRTSLRVGILALAASCLMLCVTPTSRALSEGLPARLDDRTFWTLVTEFSEPNGFFRSDNLVSNETEFQHVIPSLLHDAPASAYIGVGPEQNFTYIAALKPRIVFIVDIRRQNLLLQLMYKALFEASPTRAEFVSRLFARRAPSLRASASAAELFTAVEAQPQDPRLASATVADMRRQLTRHHHFSLSDEDWNTLEYVYGAFATAGPEIRYSFGRGAGWFPFPSYQELMVATDGDGVPRSFLATEENYRVLRDLQLRNLVVPVVGDFGGPRALRSVGAYLHTHGATVTAFYTSNVEQYLFRGDDWQRFYANVGAMPLGAHSTFIRSVFNNAFGRGAFGYRAAPYPMPPPQSMAPRSLSVLQPVADLLAAVAAGTVQSYRDLVELSVHN